MDKCKSTWHCPLSHCITEPSYIGWYSQSLYPPRCWLSYWSGVFVLAVRTIRCNVPKLALVGYGWHYSTPQNWCFHTKKQPLWALIPQWPNLYGVVTDQNVSICFSVGDSLNIVKPSVGKGRENLLRISPPNPASQRGMSSFRCLVPGAALQLPGANLKGDFQHLRLAQWNPWSLAYPEGHQWSWSFALQVPGWFNSYECSTMWMIKPIIFAHRMVGSTHKLHFGGWTSISQLSWCSRGPQSVDLLPYFVMLFVYAIESKPMWMSDLETCIKAKKHINMYYVWISISSTPSCSTRSFRKVEFQDMGPFFSHSNSQEASLGNVLNIFELLSYPIFGFVTLQRFCQMINNDQSFPSSLSLFILE